MIVFFLYFRKFGDICTVITLPPSKLFRGDKRRV